MLLTCAGYKMANAIKSLSKEMVRNFPIGTPVTVVHVCGYYVWADVNFAGDKGFIIAAFRTSTFAVAEPVMETNSMTYI